MAEIAAELGLSRRTISSVVNGRARRLGHAQETIVRVERYLAERGYVPSQAATDLHRPTLERIGLIHLGHLYTHLQTAYDDIVARLAEGQDLLELAVVPHRRLLDGVKALIARGATRVVWFQAWEREAPESPSVAGYLANCRVVIYNHLFGQGDGSATQAALALGYHLVGVDRTAAYRRIGALLRGLGHRVVALVPDYTYGDEALAASGLTVVRPPLTTRADDPAEAARQYTAFARAAMRDHAVTALCIHGAGIAQYALANLVRAGVRVPEELTVIGFDGRPESEAYAVPLTTMDMPVADMVERTLGLLRRPRKEHRHCFEMRLVERGSHGRARR